MARLDSNSEHPDLDPRDRAILGDVAAALDATDPVPDSVVASAKGILTWLTVDAELAALAEDTALAGAGVRGATAERALTFECATGVVILEVTGSGDQRQILGQTDRPADLQVRHRGTTIDVSTDEHGRFRVDGVVAGPVSLRCVFRDTPGTPIVTSWVVV
jgi:hypothetical protein